MVGNWALLYLCYVNSRFVDVQPWYQRRMEDDEPEWKLCGFAERPSYTTVYKRFRDLEVSADIFREAAAMLIQKARRRGCRVGAWQHIDGTEADTHSAPSHDCQPHENCPTREMWRKKKLERRKLNEHNGQANDEHKDQTDDEAIDQINNEPNNETNNDDQAAISSGALDELDADDLDDHWYNHGQPVLGCSTRVSADTAAAMRRKLAEAPSDDPDVTVVLDGLTTIPANQLHHDEATGSVRFTAGGHWWRSRDTTAGLRAYTNKKRVKYWMGYICITIVDHFTWAPLAIHMIPANRQEFDAYPTALAQSAENLGNALPKIIGADRGYSVEKVFRINSEMGIASAIPFRRNRMQPKDAPKAKPSDPYDEHGIPRCPGCKGGTDWVRFAVDKGTPTLWVRCAQPGPTCPKGDFRVKCSTNWRRVLPIWRTHSSYLAVRRSHHAYESTHRALRSQFGVAPNELALRPKRKGIACQQLRAFAAMVIAWLRTIELWGFGTAKRTLQAPVAPDEERLVANILRLRAENSWRGGGQGGHRGRRARRALPTTL